MTNYARFTAEAAGQVMDAVRRVRGTAPVPQSGNQELYNATLGGGFCSAKLTGNLSAGGSAAATKLRLSGGSWAQGTSDEDKITVVSNSQIFGNVGNVVQCNRYEGVWVVVQCDRNCP